MVAFWCSATAITAAAAPGPEPKLAAMTATHAMRNAGPLLAQAEAMPASGERPQAPDPAAVRETSPNGAQAVQGRRRSARQADPDYDSFRARAQQLLAAEGASRSTYSKLAEKYPEHSIVICQAGCRNKSPEIVYFAPRKVQVAELVPTAATAGQADEPKTAVDAMTCLAGCYNTPSRYPSQRSGETSRLSEEEVERYVHQQGTTPANGVVISGRWLTTVTEAERKPKRGHEIEANTSGQWMRKIEHQRRARIRRAY